MQKMLVIIRSKCRTALFYTCLLYTNIARSIATAVYPAIPQAGRVPASIFSTLYFVPGYPGHKNVDISTGFYQPYFLCPYHIQYKSYFK